MTVAKAYVSISEIDGLDAIASEVEEAIDTYLEDVANYVFDEAKESLAFQDKTHNLRNSIKLRKSRFPKGGYIVRASGANKDKGYHAHLVEYGHIAIPPGELEGMRVPPHPFLRPALEKGIAFAVAKFRSKKL